MKKLYISGGITGKDRDTVIADFLAAENLWRSMNLDVVNPLRNGLDPEADWREHMKADTEMLWDCDFIYFLPEWESSRGARVEYAIAREAKMGMFFAKDGIVNVETFNAVHGCVSDNHLMVVLRIAQKVCRKTGVSFVQIQSNGKRSPQIQFYARIMFAHECRTLMSVREIATIMKTSGDSVRYYLRKFKDEVKYNNDFARMYNNLHTEITSV